MVRVAAGRAGRNQVVMGEGCPQTSELVELTVLGIGLEGLTKDLGKNEEIQAERHRRRVEKPANKWVIYVVSVSRCGAGN